MREKKNCLALWREIWRRRPALHNALWNITKRNITKKTPNEPKTTVGQTACRQIVSNCRKNVSCRKTLLFLNFIHLISKIATNSLIQRKNYKKWTKNCICFFFFLTQEKLTGLLRPLHFFKLTSSTTLAIFVRLM